MIRQICNVILPMIVVVGLGLLFAWAGELICLGTVPLLATCLLVFLFAGVYPLFSKHK